MYAIRSYYVSLIKDEKPTLLVFDEIVGAIANNLINVEMVLNFLKEKPSNLEVVLTGRNPIPELIEIADYVSEIKKIKHVITSYSIHYTKLYDKLSGN